MDECSLQPHALGFLVLKLLHLLPPVILSKTESEENKSENEQCELRYETIHEVCGFAYSFDGHGVPFLFSMNDVRLNYGLNIFFVNKNGG